MLNILRWVALIPASYLGYYLAMISGMAVLAFAESFCPAEDVVSGMCTSQYMRQVEKILFFVFPGLAAILVVLLPTLVAPGKKVAVAITFFVPGSMAAIYLGVSLKEWATLAFALCCGGVTVWIIHMSQNNAQKTHQPSSHREP